MTTLKQLTEKIVDKYRIRFSPRGANDKQIELLEDEINFIVLALKEIVEEHFKDIMVEKKLHMHLSSHTDEEIYYDENGTYCLKCNQNRLLDQITSRHNKYLS